MFYVKIYAVKSCVNLIIFFNIYYYFIYSRVFFISVYVQVQIGVPQLFLGVKIFRVEIKFGYAGLGYDTRVNKN